MQPELNSNLSHQMKKESSPTNSLKIVYSDEIRRKCKLSVHNRDFSYDLEKNVSDDCLKYELLLRWTKKSWNRKLNY